MSLELTLVQMNIITIITTAITIMVMIIMTIIIIMAMVSGLERSIKGVAAEEFLLQPKPATGTSQAVELPFIIIIIIIVITIIIMIVITTIIMIVITIITIVISATELLRKLA